jgi:hypothetical protein
VSVSKSNPRGAGRKPLADRSDLRIQVGVSLPAELVRRIDRTYPNKSAFVRNLIEDHFNKTDAEKEFCLEDF